MIACKSFAKWLHSLRILPEHRNSTFSFCRSNLLTILMSKQLTLKEMTSRQGSSKQADDSAQIRQKKQNTDSKKEEFEFFYGNKFVFSQFHPAKFVVDNIKYNCMEQYMHHQKAVTFKDKIREGLIMETSEPKMHKKLGRQVEKFDKVIWGQKSVAVVTKGSLAKYRQNPEMKKVLLATYPKTLVEASPRDRLWGIGMGRNNPKAQNRATWRGKNLLGETLTKVRNILMKEEGVMPDTYTLPSKQQVQSSDDLKLSSEHEATPSKTKKTPQSKETPKKKKADPEKEGTPSKKRKTKSGTEDTPSNKIKAKSDTDDTPTKKRKTNSDTEDTPTKKRKANLDTVHTPSKKRKTKSDTEDTPAKMEDTPSKNRKTKTDIKDKPSNKIKSKSDTEKTPYKERKVSRDRDIEDTPSNKMSSKSDKDGTPTMKIKAKSDMEDIRKAKSDTEDTLSKKRKTKTDREDKPLKKIKVKWDIEDSSPKIKNAAASNEATPSESRKVDNESEKSIMNKEEKSSDSMKMKEGSPSNERNEFSESDNEASLSKSSDEKMQSKDTLVSSSRKELFSPSKHTQYKDSPSSEHDHDAHKSSSKLDESS